MGVVLMRGGRPICYHSEVFHGKFYKEIYAMVQAMKKWKHDMMEKETLLYIDH